jgi:hypothetical protein
MITTRKSGSALFRARDNGRRRLIAAYFVAGLGVAFLAAPAAAQAQGEAVLYAFQGPTTDGEDNANGLVAGADGVLYGATTFGGSGKCTGYGYSSPIGCGIVYELTPPATAGGAWTETILHSFTGGKDGAFPNTLSVSKSGILYGTTFGGGPGQSAGSGYGVVFRLIPPTTSGGEWKDTVMYRRQQSERRADPGRRRSLWNNGLRRDFRLRHRLPGDHGSHTYVHQSLFVQRRHRRS